MEAPLQPPRRQMRAVVKAPAKKQQDTLPDKDVKLLRPLDPEWDFSESEWAEIEASIKAAREAPLSEKDRAELRGAANDFRFNRDFRETENYSPKRRMNLWKKVAQLSGRLREAFEIACKARYGRTMAITPRQEN